MAGAWKKKNRHRPGMGVPELATEKTPSGGAGRYISGKTEGTVGARNKRFRNDPKGGKYDEGCEGEGAI